MSAIPHLRQAVGALRQLGLQSNWNLKKLNQRTSCKEHVPVKKLAREPVTLCVQSRTTVE